MRSAGLRGVVVSIICMACFLPLNLNAGEYGKLLDDEERWMGEEQIAKDNLRKSQGYIEKIKQCFGRGSTAAPDQCLRALNDVQAKLQQVRRALEKRKRALTSSPSTNTRVLGDFKVNDWNFRVSTGDKNTSYKIFCIYYNRKTGQEIAGSLSPRSTRGTQGLRGQLETIKYCAPDKHRYTKLIIEKLPNQPGGQKRTFRGDSRNDYTGPKPWYR